MCSRLYVLACEDGCPNKDTDKKNSCFRRFLLKHYCLFWGGVCYCNTSFYLEIGKASRWQTNFISIS